MTENAESYILTFGGTILKEYNGVYLVKYHGDEIRYAVVKYHYYSTGRNGFDPIPLFDVTISEEQARFFLKTCLPCIASAKRSLERENHELQL